MLASALALTLAVTVPAPVVAGVNFTRGTVCPGGGVDLGGGNRICTPTSNGAALLRARRIVVGQMVRVLVKKHKHRGHVTILK